MMKPSVGRIVHYKSYGTPGGEFGKECRAAIIAGIHGGPFEDCDLAVLNPSGMFFNIASHDEEQAGGTWHWPERTED